MSTFGQSWKMPSTEPLACGLMARILEPEFRLTWYTAMVEICGAGLDLFGD